MGNYNYANEIVKDYDQQLNQQTNYVRNYAPRENILNEQDQNIRVNADDNGYENNEPDEKRKAYQAGLRNDNIRTEKNIDEPAGADKEVTEIPVKHEIPKMNS